MTPSMGAGGPGGGAGGPGRSADASLLRRTPLYEQAAKVLEELLVRGRYRVGDRIPPEIDLMAALGVSRATIRAAVGRLVDRGLLVRRQGSGTFLASLPGGNAWLAAGGAAQCRDSGAPVPVGIKLGSAVTPPGRLETYASIAERLGRKTGIEHLVVDVAGASPDEAAALELPAGAQVTRVSRVLLIDGEPAAWMIDVFPADLLRAATVRERLPSRPMLLDLLLDAGIPVAFSEVEISAAVLDPGQPGQPGAALLGLTGPGAAIVMTETMYLDAAAADPGAAAPPAPAEGRPVQWSRNYFLPGRLSLRLVRETPAGRDPAIVLQLLADGKAH